MTEKSGGLFKCAAQTGRCGRNKVSRKVYVIEKMEDYQMKNRKRERIISIKRKFFAEGRRGPERETSVQVKAEGEYG